MASIVRRLASWVKKSLLTSSVFIDNYSFPLLFLCFLFLCFLLWPFFGLYFDSLAALAAFLASY